MFKIKITMDYKNKTVLIPRTCNYSKTSEELKPCPFCANPVIWYHTGNSNTCKYKVIIECLPCNVKMQIGGLRTPLVSLEEIIMNKWNNRK